MYVFIQNHQQELHRIYQNMGNINPFNQMNRSHSFLLISHKEKIGFLDQ
jgi:hypothetical protein